MLTKAVYLICNLVKKVILPITSVLLFTSCETEGIKPEIEQNDTD